MGHGTSSNFWNSGNDGVRITVVDASSGTAVSSPLDFSNRTQKTNLLHFGKVNKLQYLGGAGLSLQSGVAYSCIRPTQSMPTIVSSKGQSNIEAIKRYFCSEYACMMVAQAAGVDYERMIAGEYKLLIEPIAYFTHNGQYYCMTATEAGLYDQMSGGNLRKTMTSLTHKNLPLSMFLEFSDLGISAWTGSTTGKQNNSDIISTLGVGIVWFDEAPPEGEIEAPDVEYRVDTDVITAVTLRTDQDLTPDNPASVTFHILGITYRVNDIVIPAGDSQVVWVKWHTPSTPQTVTITVSVSGAYTAQDTFVAKIVDLNEHIPPDPVATDTNPGYSVPPLPSETQKLTANWGVWSCYWVPVWVWCDHGEDGGHWVDEGYWEYEYTGYSASISGEMSLMPDDIVPTASGKTMKSGYGVKTEVRATLSTDAPTSHITYPQTAFSVFPEFQYQTYLRLLQRSGGQSAKFIFKPNEFSTYDRTVHFTPLWFPDATDYTIYTQVWDTWTPDGMLSINLLHEFCSHIQVECNGRGIFICRAKVFACALNNQGPTFCIGRRHMALHMVFPEILLQKDHLSLILEITLDLPDNNFLLVVTIQAAKETSVKIRYCHIMTPLRFIVDWNSLLPIHPPVISGIIVCGLDLKDRCGAIRQFHKVVHISQHPRILGVLEHLFDLVDPISGFPLEYLCYQRLQQMPHFHGNPVALIIFH